MSIIITFILHNQAFMFSEGRLTTTTEWKSDTFDKTLSIFNGKTICAFCGFVILDKIGKRDTTDVRMLLEKIAKTRPKMKFHRFLKSMNIIIERHLKNTHPHTERKIDLHLVRRLKSGIFEFRRYSFSCNRHQRYRVNKFICKTMNFYRTDGDDGALTAVNAFLGSGINIQNSEQAIIAHNETAINNGINVSGHNETAIALCGGTLYHTKLR